MCINNYDKSMRTAIVLHQITVTSMFDHKRHNMPASLVYQIISGPKHLQLCPKPILPQPQT